MTFSFRFDLSICPSVNTGLRMLLRNYVIAGVHCERIFVSSLLAARFARWAELFDSRCVPCFPGRKPSRFAHSILFSVMFVYKLCLTKLIVFTKALSFKVRCIWARLTIWHISSSDDSIGTLDYSIKLFHVERHIDKLFLALSSFLLFNLLLLLGFLAYDVLGIWRALFRKNYLSLLLASLVWSFSSSHRLRHCSARLN